MQYWQDWVADEQDDRSLERHDETDPVGTLRARHAFSVGPDYRIRHWTPWAEELLGYAGEEVLGARCYTVLRGEHLTGRPICGPECHPMQAMRQGRISSESSCTVTHRDGYRIPVHLAGVPREPCVRSAPDESCADVFLWRSVEPWEGELALDPQVRFYTLGHFFVTVGSQELDVRRWARKKALTVLQYLLTHRGRPVHREMLSAAVWPDETGDRVWERLRVLVYFLRQTLREAGVSGEVIGTSESGYFLNTAAIWVDADVFERRVREARRLEAAGHRDLAREFYEEAELLYRGEFMADAPYEDFVHEEQLRLGMLHEAVREQLQT